MTELPTPPVLSKRSSAYLDDVPAEVVAAGERERFRRRCGAAS